jgi:non-ribosomal peptide synthetase component F
VYLGRSFALLEAILGILKAGVTYVPLDPLHPQERLAWLLSHSQSVILLTEHRMQCPFSEGVDIVFLDESQLSMREESRANPVIEASGDNVAYLLYTSGSTGHPKGNGVCGGIRRRYPDSAERPNSPIRVNWF